MRGHRWKRLGMTATEWVEKVLVVRGAERRRAEGNRAKRRRRKARR